MALMIWRGVIDPQTWLSVAVASPFSMLGTQTGIFVFRRLNDRQFQQLLGRLIFINDAKRLKFETKIINNWYFTAFFLNIMNARLHASWNFDWIFKLQNLNKNPRAAF